MIEISLVRMLESFCSSAKRIVVSGIKRSGKIEAWRSWIDCRGSASGFIESPAIWDVAALLSRNGFSHDLLL
jgi:hypothetical protein